jgi:CRP-like cAMP-binding protein
MSSPKVPHFFEVSGENRILASLPRKEYEHLLPELAHVRLPQGKVLWNVGDAIPYAFFLLNGMVSLLSTTEEGSSVEVGMIGNEGLAGIAGILRIDAAPYQSVVQLPTSALRIKVDALRREFRLGGHLQHLLLRYTHALIMQISQSAACHRFHTAEERLCRWLLTGSKRADSNTLQLTQEFLAQMIGVPRTNVTMIASRIQKTGCISYRRGTITILDRRLLETFSCECHRVVSAELENYTAA